MKKRVVSLFLAAVLAVSVLAGCGADSKDGKSGGTAESGQDKTVTSSSAAGEDAGKNTEKGPSKDPSDSEKEKEENNTQPKESGTSQTSTAAGDEGGPSPALNSGALIARRVLENQINKNNTVEYSYMNTIRCQANGTEVSAETANEVKAYGGVTGDVLTVEKESDLISDGQTKKHAMFWYDQNGNVYVSDQYHEENGFVDWRVGNSGSGMTWMNETGLEVYQAIADGLIKPEVLENKERTNYILYFTLDGSQTKSLFGRLFDDVSFNGIRVSAENAGRVEVRVIVRQKSYEPHALSIKAENFVCSDEISDINISSYDISLIYTHLSGSDDPLIIPEDIIKQARESSEDSVLPEEDPSEHEGDDENSMW